MYLTQMCFRDILYYKNLESQMTSEVDKSFPSSCDHLLSSKSVLSFEFFKLTDTDRLRVRRKNLPKVQLGIFLPSKYLSEIEF